MNADNGGGGGGASSSTPVINVSMRSNVDLMNILQVRIPNEIAELDGLLASPIYAVNLTQPRRTTDAAGQQNTVAANLQRVGVDSNESSSEQGVHVPANEAIVQLLDELEEKFVKIRKHACDLEHWLTMSMPMIETGCDMRMEAKRLASVMVKRIQIENSGRHLAITDYHITRAGLLQKFMDEPGFYDALLAVEKYDAGRLEIFKMNAVQMKNSYEELLHFFQLNMDYII